MLSEAPRKKVWQSTVSYLDGETVFQRVLREPWRKHTDIAKTGGNCADREEG